MLDKILTWVKANPSRAIIAALATLVVILGFATCARADTVNVTWTAPTLREDGTALTAAEIAGYQLEWTVKGIAQPGKLIPPGTAYVLDTGTLTGKTCVTLATVDTDGLTSAPSGQACRNSRPNAPTALKVK